MAIEFLSTKDQDIVLRCMKSTASFIDDCEKHTRLGIEGDELERLIKQWPDIDDRDQTGSGFLAINNSLNEVCHGFRIATSEWGNWFDTPMEEVQSAYGRWLALTGTSGGNTLRAVSLVRSHRERHPSGAKAPRFLAAFSARLKSCPFARLH